MLQWRQATFRKPGNWCMPWNRMELLPIATRSPRWWSHWGKTRHLDTCKSASTSWVVLASRLRPNQDGWSSWVVQTVVLGWFFERFVKIWHVLLCSKMVEVYPTERVWRMGILPNSHSRGKRMTNRLFSIVRQIQNTQDMPCCNDLFESLWFAEELWQDEILLNIVLETTARNKEFKRLEWILQSFETSKMRPSTATYGSLIKAYGNVEASKEVLADVEGDDRAQRLETNRYRNWLYARCFSLQQPGGWCRTDFCWAVISSECDSVTQLHCQNPFCLGLLIDFVELINDSSCSWKNLQQFSAKVFHHFQRPVLQPPAEENLGLGLLMF